MVNQKYLKKVLDKLKNNLIILFLIVTILFFLIYVVFSLNYKKESIFSYAILDCDENDIDEYLNISNNTLFLKLITNCCGTDFKIYKYVEKVIVEEKVVGELCRCVCGRKVLIYPFKENNKLVIIKRDCKYYLYKIEKSYYKLEELNRSC